MRKFTVFASLASAALLLGATVGYASMNGTFEGNSIVKVFSEGEELSVHDTPAINYNGRTMVPIYMLREAGLNVQWNASTESVEISNPVVLYSTAAAHYKNLSDISQSLSALSFADLALVTFSGANGETAVLINHTESLLEDAKTKLEREKKASLEFFHRNDDLQPRADAQEIVTKLEDSMEYFEAALDVLKQSYANNELETPSDFRRNTSKSFGLAREARLLSDNGYKQMYEYIQE
ncbi:copper amine oxidase N-terminal domain-containing protein [Paenibacillus sp. TRM 82003]|nr:copper amine oxidase N-terminal domain-containing protein [Paenibacillus sp. TRM 82003]